MSGFLKQLEEKQRKRRMANRQPYELFKFQRPLSFIGKDPSVLIYNEAKVHIFNIPYDTIEVDALFQGAPKVYVWGRFNEDNDYFEFDTSRQVIRNPEEYPEW